MAARFLTDPDQMWAMARKFDTHAQRVEAEGRRLWPAAADSAAGTPEDPPREMHWSFCNVVTMLRDVRDGLVRIATRYENEESASRDLLGGLTGRTFGGV
jgi:hypothetical protein